jgi:hypothetical protein
VTPFYFVKVHEPGLPPRNTQTFSMLTAAHRHAARCKLQHPDWRVEVVQHDGGVQVILDAYLARPWGR